MNPSQTGPNIYPTLPPIQNHQYPPQFPSQARYSNYLPPAQYGNIQARADKEGERQILLAKMNEIEKGFGGCFIKLYQVWLWLLGILSFLAVVRSIFWLVISYIGPHSHENERIMIFSSIVLLWIVIQSAYGLQAISQRNIKKAVITCWMVTLGLIPSLVFEICLLVIIAENPHPSPGNQGMAMVWLLTIVFSVQILLHVAISMVGAFKVKKILVERELVQEKLNEVDYSLQV